MRVSLTLAIFLLLSCGRIRNEGHAVVDRAKNAVKAKESKLLDKIASHFDYYTPDTKANKQRFREYFGFYPGADVKNLYIYNDDMFLDATYYFGFTCADSTRQKLVDSLQLHPDRKNMSFGGGLFSSPFPWWDTAAIQKIRPYSRVDESKNLHWYLWYDPATSRAFFFTYTM